MAGSCNNSIIFFQFTHNDIVTGNDCVKKEFPKLYSPGSSA